MYDGCDGAVLIMADGSVWVSLILVLLFHSCNDCLCLARA